MRAALASYIEDASIPRLTGKLIGLIAPHSQLSEFGPVAGWAYQALVTAPLTWDQTLMLAPTAHALDTLVCDPSDAYDTPLDPLGIDRAALEDVRQAGLTVADDPDDEPVIECHAPFVQAALGNVSVLPIRVPERASVAYYAPLARQTRIGMVIACANLPGGHEHGACEAITQLDPAFFDGDPAAQKRGVFRRMVKPARSPDTTTLALALTLAKARGAAQGQVLKRAGVFAAIALTR